MKKLEYNKTILLFLNVNDMLTFKQGELKKLKNEYLKTYDNCVIYNYFDIKNHKNLIKDKINKLKFEKQIKINARECKILHINNNEKNLFLNNNHIQGTDKSQIFYGAYHENTLMGVMSFDIKNKMNGGVSNGEYELSRFSIKIGYVIVGLFGKILKQFVTDYFPQKIISYADLNMVSKDHNIYVHNDFKLIKNILPDFKTYLKSKDEIYHKFTYGNKFFNDESILNIDKEKIKNDSHKIWNCGKLKYLLLINENNKIIFGFIYAIKNKINNKIYIGQTTRTLNKRIYEYKAAFNRNSFYNQYLLNSFNKYGWDNFEFSIIDSATTLDELNEKEIQYIQKHKSNDKEFGYNIECGGRNAIPDIETLERMSRSHLGIIQSDDWINKRIAKSGSDDAKKYGKKKTDEEKQALSIRSPKFWLGKTRDIETKNKISKTKKERGMSSKQKAILCKPVIKRNSATNNIITIYESTAIAAINELVNQSTVSRWCKNNKIINGILWSY